MKYVLLVLFLLFGVAVWHSYYVPLDDEVLDQLKVQYCEDHGLDPDEYILVQHEHFPGIYEIHPTHDQ